MFLAIFLLFSVLILLYGYLVWNFNYWKKRNVPGPKPKPLVGNFPGTFMQTVNTIYEIDTIYKKYRGSTPFVGIFSGRNPQVMALDSELVKDVYIKKFKNFRDNEFADLIDKKTDPIFSRNPFMLSGDEWKEKRAEITPAFTQSKTKAMYPIMDDVCVKMNKFIKQEILKSPENGLDTKELAARYTTDVVSSCIYGVDSKAFTDEKSIIRQMGTELFKPSFFLILYFTILAVFPFIGRFYQMPFVPKKVEVFFTQLMTDAVKMRNESNSSRDDYLNYLLELRKKKPISDLDMAAHTITFFLDGFETSSVVISHILYALAAHKDVQEKLRTEINETIKKDRSINFDNINEMEYLEQVFNETLRMFPPLGVATRKCTIPTEFTDNKDKVIEIGKDLVVMIPVYSIQHDPEHYPNPDKFDPERFSNENGGLKKYKDKCVFLPFGDGPRICLGMRFGTTQSKAAVVEIVKNFKLTVNKKTKEPYVVDPKEFILKPVGGLWLNFEPIKN